MTAETILNSVLLEIGLDYTNPQLSSSDFTLRQIRQFMNAAGKDIAGRAEWSRLYKSETVPGGVDSHPLPSDFKEMAEAGAVRLNKAGFSPVLPVAAPEMWVLLKQRPSSQPYYHLTDGTVAFSPVLDADGAVFRYVSRNWVEGKAEIAQNGDNLLIPERLVEKGTIWRWRRQKGLPFDDLLAEFEADLIAEIKADRGAV